MRLACCERVLAIANFLDGWDLLDSCEVERKFVSARRRNQTRETRALPGTWTAILDLVEVRGAFELNRFNVARF